MATRQPRGMMDNSPADDDTQAHEMGESTHKERMEERAGTPSTKPPKPSSTRPSVSYGAGGRGRRIGTIDTSDGS